VTRCGIEIGSRSLPTRHSNSLRCVPFQSALAQEANESRIWAGIHYRSDTVAGAALGRAVANKVIDAARKDGSQ
jgi:hypothetical protein